LFARLVVGILGGLLLGIAGAGLCMLAFGSDSGYWALLLFWIGSVGVAIAAPDFTHACRWLFIASGLATLLLVFSSAIVSERLLPHVDGPLQSASGETDTTILLLGMMLGGLALFAGLWIGRDPTPMPRTRAAGTDVTDNFELGAQGATWTGQHLKLPPRTRRLQYGLLALLVTFTCALLLWNARGPTDAEPAAVAPPAPPAEPAPLQASALPVPAETPPPAAAAPAVTASHARQECMAQVEAARLFLSLARSSSSRGDYEVRIRDELERFRRERPVGPRTLTLISTAMWSRRGSPDPAPAVWSREYSQCEQTRNSGSFYVVRGGPARN
jgi:hypothetical protein